MLIFEQQIIEHFGTCF